MKIKEIRCRLLEIYKEITYANLPLLREETARLIDDLTKIVSGEKAMNEWICNVEYLFKRGNKIEVIKHIREVSKMGLKDAKKLVDKYWGVSEYERNNWFPLYSQKVREIAIGCNSYFRGISCEQ